MRSFTNLVFVTLSVLIIYSNCLCLCSRRGRVRAEDDGPQDDGLWASECNTKCPDTDWLVCDTGNNTHQNYCYLKQEMCKGEPVKLKYLGRCGELECGICTMELQLICGTDGKTYGNQCDISHAMACRGEDVMPAYEGPCKAGKLRRECDPYCPRIYRPVCGTDGKTYANMCRLEYHMCIGENVALAYQGRCKEPEVGPKSSEEEEQDYHH